MIIVSNTSPISNLARVGHLEIIQQIYGKIIIPTAVCDELTHKGAGEIVARAVKELSWIETQPLADLTRANNLQNTLNKGEAEAIALALELNANELLIDERLGRREAMGLGISVTGALGILVIAKNRGLIAEVKPIIDELISEVVFRVSDRLYADILQQAGE